jgi:hypothetical protein
VPSRGDFLASTVEADSMGRYLVGGIVGASAVALITPDRRRCVRGTLRRLARACGGFGDERVAKKLLLKKAAGYLDAAGVPFLLAGGTACWAYGGPFFKDVDLAIRSADVERAMAALRSAGLRIVRRPEHWLFQAYEHGLNVDVIYRPVGYRVQDELFHRSRIEVDGVMMSVLPLEDVFVSRLLSVSEDTVSKLERYLASARAVREQVDWMDVDARTAHSPFARAFFTMLSELGIVDLAAPACPQVVQMPSVTDPDAGREPEAVALTAEL